VTDIKRKDQIYQLSEAVKAKKARAEQKGYFTVKIVPEVASGQQPYY